MAARLTASKPVGSALKEDALHRAAAFLQTDAKGGTYFRFLGDDGVERNLIQMPTEVNGKQGTVEWIFDDAGNLTHQRFKPGATVNGIPN